MKIKKIKLNGFGIFNTSYVVELDEKINIFIGKNESGKSTIIKGIMAILFGLKKNEWDLLKPWENNVEVNFGELEFSVNDDVFYLYREFENNKIVFKRNDEEIFSGNASPSSRTEEKEFYMTQLKSIIGFNDKDVFYNTNVIMQKSIESDITGDIQSVITGATGANYNVILNKWTDEYFNLTRHSRWDFVKNKNKNRVIENLEEELAALKEKKSKMTENFIKGSELEKKLDESEDKLKVLTEKLNLKNKEYESINSYIQFIKEKNYVLEKINEINENIQKVEDISTELSAKNNLINKVYKDYDKLDEENISDYNFLQKLEKELIEKERIFNNIKNEKRPSIKGNIILSLNLFMFSTLVALLGFKFKDNLFFYIGGGLFLIFLVYFIISLIKKTSQKVKYNSKYISAESDVNKVKEQINLLYRKLDNVKSIIDIPNFLDKYKEYKQVIQEIENLKSQLSVLQSKENLLNEKNELNLKLTDITSRILVLEKENAGLTNISENLEKSMEYTTSLKSEIDNLNEEKKNLENNIFQLKSELSSLVSTNDSIATIEYEINDIEEELENLRFNRDAYTLAITTLYNAIKEYQEKHIERLSKNVSEFFSVITNKKYKSVELNANFTPIVKYKDTDIEVKKGNLDILSCGTEEQLFFAMRISLIKEINNITYLPLILDDPFVNFDIERLKVVKELLKKIAEKNQILLFTHSEEYGKWKNSKIMIM